VSGLWRIFRNHQRHQHANVQIIKQVILHIEQIAFSVLVTKYLIPCRRCLELPVLGERQPMLHNPDIGAFQRLAVLLQPPPPFLSPHGLRNPLLRRSIAHSI
jgi:hypothetical protein